jgi:cation transport ATPase
VPFYYVVFLKVTGDNRTTAEALAEELDLPKDRILAGVLPKDKVTKVGVFHVLHCRQKICFCAVDC